MSTNCFSSVCVRQHIELFYFSRKSGATQIEWDDSKRFCSYHKLKGHFRVIGASVSKRVLMQNLAHENEFNLHENEYVGKHILK